LLASGCVLAPGKNGVAYPGDPVTQSNPATNSVGMVAWIVPIARRSAYLQVRLDPHLAVGRAVVSVQATGVDASPRRIVVTDLEPGRTASLSSPVPNPQPLGITYLRTFRLTATHSGTFRIVVTLVFKNISSRQALNFTVN